MAMKINKWTILKKVDRRRGEDIVLAKCDCGTEKKVILNTILKGQSKCCGCTSVRKNIGKRFGNLIAIKSLGKPYWLFKCDCGNKIKKNIRNIEKRSIKTLHCGCKKTKSLKEEAKKKIKYNIIIDKNDCWIWQKWKDRYGKLTFNGKNWRAHRLAYFVFKGEIPKGMYVCHSCDVPLCCNPDHLFLGNQTDNMCDMVKKERSTKGRKHSLETRNKMSLSQIKRHKNQREQD